MVTPFFKLPKAKHCKSFLTPLLHTLLVYQEVLGAPSQYIKTLPFLVIHFWATVIDPGGSDCKESACSAGDPDSIPRPGRSPGEGNGDPLQYSWLDENFMDRGAWQTTVHGVTKSQAWLSVYDIDICAFVFITLSLLYMHTFTPSHTHMY